MTTHLVLLADTHPPKRARALPDEVGAAVDAADLVLPAGDWVDVALLPDLDVLVFGHSHVPWGTTTPSGLRLLDPGSPTDRRRQTAGTYLTRTVDGGSVTRSELVSITRR